MLPVYIHSQKDKIIICCQSILFTVQKDKFTWKLIDKINLVIKVKDHMLPVYSYSLVKGLEPTAGI